MEARQVWATTLPMDTEPDAAVRVVHENRMLALHPRATRAEPAELPDAPPALPRPSRRQTCDTVPTSASRVAALAAARQVLEDQLAVEIAARMRR